MLEQDDRDDDQSDATRSSDEPRWYNRLQPAALAFALAFSALVVALVTAPADDSVGRFAMTPAPADGTVRPPNPTPSAPPVESAAAVGVAEPRVLGAVEDNGESPAQSDDATEPPAAGSEATVPPRPRGPVASETLVVSIGATPVDTDQLRPTTVANGSLRTAWGFDGADLATIPAVGQFVLISFSLAGEITFDVEASSVIDVRCVSGDCPDGWSTWTELPAGVVEPGQTITLVARSELDRDARFELRPHPDPTIYVIS